jgi:ArsR family metal-binding transcriptional regulator
VAFHADQIAISNVEDRAGAIQELDGLVKLINRTWERRAELTPDYDMHQRPTPMALYKLLPGTNPQGALRQAQGRLFGSCRQCGQPTCWNFALKLVAAQVELADCPPLQTPTYAAQLTRLQALVVPMPAIE